MSESEKATLENLTKILHKVPDEKKEYFMGFANGVLLMAEGKKTNRKSKKAKKA